MNKFYQQLNIHTKKCTRKGIVTHELLHALGFFHQQSASNRDEYVKILWENIKLGEKRNFKAYNSSIATDYGVEYDFNMIMHYSKTAFSKNDKVTIVSIKNATIPEKSNELTEKDIKEIKYYVQR